MLQLKTISKQYQTGDLVQTALDGVSLNFRDNEFVAILGPSGSGKTTLLNIIGGLDRYDQGDLIINGISTKRYSDRDWDSYRNHTIGFVFQSYNLIPHQTVLRNVELALTISGISKAERRRRAKEALAQVGLGDQLHKKPNQMSGGQMQRVAIARALINNPSILLADEPTGALDTATSVQVMELLKEVAKDRMVIMVTHNPELAEEYATRIVRLQDGRIIDDTDPFVVDEGIQGEPMHKNMGHASMSLFTSLGLSLNNLMTKRGRTFLTAFAGSIGIIGIALILSVSAGVNDYIDTLEEETMSEYPIQVTSSGFDLSSMLTISVGSATTVQEEEDVVSVTEMISKMFSMFNSNDLVSFKEYLESGQSDIDTYAKAVEYIYDQDIQLYLETDDEIYQVNPETTLTSSFGLSSTLMSMMSMSSNIFYEMPENEALYMDSYEVKAGRWPENYNECVLVLTTEGSVSDYMVYMLGLRDYHEYEELVEKAANGEEVSGVEYLETYTYEQIIGTTYKLVNSADYYEYDEEYGLWKDKTDDEEYMKNLVANGEEITIVGVVMPMENAVSAALTEGLNYPRSLLEHVAELAAESEIVKEQLANPEINVFTGEEFGEDTEFDMESLFSIDEDALSNLFDTDAMTDALSGLDLSEMDLGAVDLSGIDFGDSTLDLSELDLSGMDMSTMLADIDMTSLIDTSSAGDLATLLLTGYQSYAAMLGLSTYSDLQTDFSSYLISDEARQILASAVKDMMEGAVGEISRTDALALLSQLNASEDEAAEVLNAWIAEKISSASITDSQISALSASLTSGYATYAVANGLTTAESISAGFSTYLTSDAATQMMTYGLLSMINTDALTGIISAAVEAAVTQTMTTVSTAMAAQMEAQMTTIVTEMTIQITEAVSTAMASAMSGLSDSLTDAMSFDEDAFANAFTINMDENTLVELMSSLSTGSSSSYEDNLAALGYVDFSSPSEIDIYPRDFDSKDAITDILDGYNTMMDEAGEEEKEITYTDLVGTMMSTVSTIINLISYVLIAFVSVSLIVSSIMIGIITYISVLERTREIGILRAIGASKRNISQIFNAETFIVGLCAGILGVLICLLLLIPINMVVHHVVQADNARAYLPVANGIFLVILSVVLTLIGGIIPSKKASRMDPVSALRSE